MIKEKTNLEKAYDQIKLICKEYDVTIEWEDYSYCYVVDNNSNNYIPIKRNMIY